MSTVDVPESYELVVGPDGGIPAEQLARLGLRPGAYLRVVNDRLHREIDLAARCLSRLSVACQRDGTTLLPGAWDHLEV